jgi:peptidoglycan/LPS O-acetylase OafA/YrhL
MDLFLVESGAGTSRLPYLWTAVLPSFLFGMVAYSYRKSLPRRRALLIALSVAAVAACWLNGGLANLLMVPAIGYATFYVAFSGHIRLHDFAKNGDFSYGTYLYAFPIQQMLQTPFGASLSLASYICTSFALSLIAGIASWHLVEKHFLGYRAGRSLRAASVIASELPYLNGPSAASLEA